MSKIIRCAVYTRKSTEDGLEQDFNSLDAQREASLAYIKSQHHEGWRAVKKIYDDGGISGGTLNRPAIQELLSDIKAGQIDTVVVYKVDRLTRSLADFSKLIELFDKHNVSFISVTQQFNTTSSMGRLTLNVLLSFAQFEREITGERIRDKIAASKKKGMWMGGLPPLGYEVKDKGLKINEAEAETVKTLYDLYLEFGSVREVKEKADRLYLKTKERKYNGNITGGKSFSRGHLYHLLKNPLYAGKVRYKDNVYDGQHEAIIDHSIWEEVQNKLSDNTFTRHSHSNQKQHNILKGLIYDEYDHLLTPHYAKKQNRKYKYYVSAQNSQSGWRIPAKELEQAIISCLYQWLKYQTNIFEAFEDIITKHPEKMKSLTNKATQISETIQTKSSNELIKLFKMIISKINLSKKQLDIFLNKKELIRLFGLPFTELENEETIHIQSSHKIRRRGQEKKIIIYGKNKSSKDENLIALISRSHRWLQQLKNGQVKTVSEIAAKENMDDGDVSRFIQFAFLSPEIVTSIFEGKQPTNLTIEKLKRLGTLPFSWTEQKARLGY